MTSKYPCRKVKQLSILAAVFFTGGALIPAGSGWGMYGAGEAHAVGIMQSLLKGTLVIASAGGGKTADQGDTSTEGDTATMSTATDQSPTQPVEPEVPRTDSNGLRGSLF